MEESKDKGTPEEKEPKGENIEAGLKKMAFLITGRMSAIAVLLESRRINALTVPALMLSKNEYAEVVKKIADAMERTAKKEVTREEVEAAADLYLQGSLDELERSNYMKAMRVLDPEAQGLERIIRLNNNDDYGLMEKSALYLLATAEGMRIFNDTKEKRAEKFPSSEQARLKGIYNRMRKYYEAHAGEVAAPDLGKQVLTADYLEVNPEAAGILPAFILEELKRKPKQRKLPASIGAFTPVQEFFRGIPNSIITETIIETGLREYKRDRLGKGSIERRTKKRSAEISWTNIDKLMGSQGVPMRKILDYGIMELSSKNQYKPGGKAVIKTRIDFPLLQFLNICGFLDTGNNPESERKLSEKLKIHRGIIRDSLKDLLNVSVTANEYNNTGTGMVLVQDYNVGESVVSINFGEKIAQHLLSLPLAQLPEALFLIDNRNMNAYALGRQMAIHYSLDMNQGEAGRNALSVETLLSHAPQIQGIEEVKEKRQSWKQKIKDVLERALNEVQKAGVISFWGYRAPRNTKKYTPEEAARLTWEEYRCLMVVYECQEVPDNKERIERKFKRIERAQKKKEQREIAIEAARRDNAASKA